MQELTRTRISSPFNVVKSAADRDRSGSGKLDNKDKWNRCLTVAPIGSGPNTGASYEQHGT